MKLKPLIGKCMMGILMKEHFYRIDDSKFYLVFTENFNLTKIFLINNEFHKT